MKVHDILKNRVPTLEPVPSDTVELGFLPKRLLAAGYDWPGVHQLLGTDLVVFAGFPGYSWRCRRDASPRARMIQFWLLGEPLQRPQIDEILGADGVDILLQRRIIREEDGDRITALVDLYPCEGAYVFTDHSFGVVRFKKHVYELGSDSYGLARMTPRKKVGQALDLCTGSGIHAILASAHADCCTGVDISDRAITFARVNAAMNGASARTRFVQGDLYEAVPDQSFDLIIANPPWIAAPSANMELYRWGGETGEALTRKVVEGLPIHLKVGGTLTMFVIYPIIRGQAYLDRLQSWLPTTGFGVAVCEFNQAPLEDFVRLHLEAREDWGRYMRECAAWMDAYDRNCIERMGIGVAYIRRLPERQKRWTAWRNLPIPPASLAPLVESWLDALARFNDPAWSPDWNRWCPAVSNTIGRIWRDVQSGAGRAEFRNPAWGGPVPLTVDEMTLVDMLGRDETAGEIAERWGGRAPEPAVREQVGDLLHSLGVKEIV